MLQPGNSTSTQKVKWLWFHKLGSPIYFYHFAGKYAPWCGCIALMLFIVGLYLGLVIAPPDYQMGDSYRIIFLHVPTAWLSMFTYVVMATASATALIWKMKIGHAIAHACAPLGAVFTVLALVTGSLWGKPTWGTYWIWGDARLISELVMLFLYLGYMALLGAIEDKRNASKAAAVLALVGVVNIPIIHFSVEWWHTLHQGATISKFERASMDNRMLAPLLVMFLAINFYFAAALFNRVRCEILSQERQTQWVRNLIKAPTNV